MTLSQEKFIENYTKLMPQVDKNDIGKVVRFCSLFKTDDLELFNKFKDSSQSIDDIINLYAERYDLNPQSDIEKIMYIFVENSINNGVSYHLNSSANQSSIFDIGLGASSIGIKTEERSDYERLQAIASPELFKKLEPFQGEKKGSKLYYSNKPILSARYGKMPEWIQELKTNSSFVDFGDELEAKNLANEILQKYDKKYSNKGRELFILPYLGKKISEDDLENFLKDCDPKYIMSFLYDNVLNAVDEYYTKHVPSSNIISIDLKDLNLHFLGRSGEIETINPYEKNDRVAQADDSQKNTFSLQDIVRRGIQSGISLDDVNEYDMKSNKQKESKENDRNGEK